MALRERFARGIGALDMRVLGAYGAIYFLWGANFLAVRYAVAGLPPLLTIAVRSLIAGAILFAWASQSGARPHAQDWRAAAIGGLCFFGLCHGTLAWAAQYVPSGLSAVILALIPAWVALLSWIRPGGARPSGLTAIGLLLSFAGVVALVLPDIAASGASPSALAAALLVGAALAWAVGTVYSSSVATGVAPIPMAGMQLICGGAMVLVVSLLAGEASRLDIAAIDARSWLALAYLILIGSLVSFSAYVWLLRVSSPARVATYAYVNPVVAVALGWAVAGEQFTLWHLATSLAIVAGVVLIITARQRPA